MDLEFVIPAHATCTMNSGTPDHMPAPAPASAPAPDLTQAEHDIRQLCAEVLSRPPERIKLHRSFVAQGGDSLLAIKLMARCRGAGYAIDVQDLLQASSIREFCACVAPKAGPDPAREEVVNVTVSSSSSSEGAEPPTADASSSSSENGLATPPSPLSEEDELPTIEIAISDVDASVREKLSSLSSDLVRDVECVFPCSSTQELFLAAQAAHPGMYHTTVAVEIHPTAPATVLDVTRVRDAWNALTRRHPSLRTVFIDSAKRPGHYDQVIFRDIISPLQVVDGDTSSLASFTSRKPLSFPNYAPTHAASLFHHSAAAAAAENAKGCFYLRIDISRAVVDGESFHILFRDLRRAYAGYGNAVLTPAQQGSPMPYESFVSHQQRLPTSPAAAYWSSYLAGAEPSLFPVLSEPDSPRENLSRTCIRIATDPRLLSAVCASLNVTVSNICQVAWALVLRAYAVSEEVCFAYASSGRQAPLAGIEDAIGAFADSMTLRMPTSSLDTVADALLQAKRDFLRGFRHPFSLAVGDEAAARAFARARGNTIMSCQRSLKSELCALAEKEQGGLGFDVVDAVNPSEVSLSFPPLPPPFGTHSPRPPPNVEKKNSLISR